MAKVNKTILMNMLSEKFGAEATKGLELTDEMLLGIAEDEIATNKQNTILVEEDPKSNKKVNDNGSKNIIDTNTGNELNMATQTGTLLFPEINKQKEGGLEGIDTSKLTHGEKMLYDAFMKDKKETAQDSINNTIESCMLDPKLKVILTRMKNSGSNIKDIRETIKEFSEMTRQTQRTTGMGSKVYPVGKIKGTVKPTTPKFGTRDFGQMLAGKKNK